MHLTFFIVSDSLYYVLIIPAGPDGCTTASFGEFYFDLGRDAIARRKISECNAMEV